MLAILSSDQPPPKRFIVEGVTFEITTSTGGVFRYRLP